MEMKYFPSSEMGVLKRPVDRNPRNLIAFGVTGSAKTTILERYAQKEYENGSKIVSVFDSKDDLESAFSLFPPSNKQKAIMKEILGNMENYVEKTYTTKIFHPLCHNIPKKLPSCFEIFTIPLNSMTLDDISFLAENTKPTVSSRVLYNILKNLKNKTNLVDFFSQVGDLSKRSDASVYFGHRIKMRSGTMKSYALKIFIEFHDEYTISSGINPLALIEEKLIKELNDNKTFTVFSTKWIGDKKSKFFITLWIMNQIARLKTEGKINPKIVLIIKDLHTLAPRFYNFDEMYKTVMVNEIYTILSTFRSKDIEIVADNQDPTTLNTRLVGQFTEVFVAPVFTPSEVQFFAESGAFMDKNILSIISSLKSHRIKKFYDVGSGEFVTILYPNHRHKEPGDNFFQYWEKYYNKYKDWTNSIANSKLEMELSEQKLKTEEKEIEEEKKVEEIKVEEGLPEEIKSLGEFVRADVERLLNIKSRTASTKIKEWKDKGFIEAVGDPSSKNVKYKVVPSS